MQLMAVMRRRAALVINPAVKCVFKQTPAQKAGAITQTQTDRTGAENERFPEKKEQHCQRIADETHPVVESTRGQVDQMALAGMLKELSFYLEVSSH